jgi:F-type H+-transporting ATPase subunit delta
VSDRAVAARYARALLDVAVGESDPDRIEVEIDDFIDFVGRHPALLQALTSPAIPASKKRGVIEALLARAPQAPVFAKLLVLLADRDRLTLLPQIRAAYRERLLDLRKVVRAEVTTATPLTERGQRALAERLASATGRRVSVTIRVDPSILGGIVARVGSVIYDGSVVRQLARMKERLTDEA